MSMSSADAGTALAARLLELLAGRGATLATAESCTGGRIAAALTAVPGSSRVFLGGIVAYSNRVKVELLGVSPRTIEEYGAVSEQCAREMALGARGRFASDFAIAVTGIAGPEGGSVEKPVGTVWFAWATSESVSAELKLLTGGRAAVQDQAAEFALEGLWRELA